MRIAIVGAAGMLGVQLARHLVGNPRLGGQKILSLDLFDIVEPLRPQADQVNVACAAIDLATEAGCAQIVGSEPDIIFHLAAVVSGEAEADFDKGYRINLDGSRMLFDAIRLKNQASGYFPKVVFASSIAVYGAPLPFPIPDDFHLTPRTSYGTQKAISELLLADYSRRGFFDGIGLRLPTVCIRPGKPNKAASGFFSSILREPLNGQPAVLPVPTTVRHWHTSPRSAVGFLIHAAQLDTSEMGVRRTLNMPGVSATVQEQINALGRVAGHESTQLIRADPDPAIEEMVQGWAAGFDTRQSLALGFVSEQNFDEIIQTYIDDELGGKR